jgi:hypothetical protein
MSVAPHFSFRRRHCRVCSIFHYTVSPPIKQAFSPLRPPGAHPAQNFQKINDFPGKLWHNQKS